MKSDEHVPFSFLVGPLQQVRSQTKPWRVSPRRPSAPSLFPWKTEKNGKNEFRIGGNAVDPCKVASPRGTARWPILNWWQRIRTLQSRCCSSMCDHGENRDETNITWIGGNAVEPCKTQNYSKRNPRENHDRSERSSLTAITEWTMANLWVPSAPSSWTWKTWKIEKNEKEKKLPKKKKIHSRSADCIALLARYKHY